MTGLAASLSTNPRDLRRTAAFVALTAICLVPTADAGAPAERVKGFFCNDKSDSIAFLALQARGENEEMAANAVNKSIARFSCAYYIPATAIHTGDHTVVENGIVYKLQSYLFLPEKVERWSGTVFGSLQPTTVGKLDV